MIDYVDFVQALGRQYVNMQRSKPTVVPRERVGSQVGVVKCRLDGSSAGPGYRPRDGDAGFLAPRTPVYRVVDRTPQEAVAVPLNGAFVLYTAAPPGG